MAQPIPTPLSLQRVATASARGVLPPTSAHLVQTTHVFGRFAPLLDYLAGDGTLEAGHVKLGEQDARSCVRLGMLALMPPLGLRHERIPLRDALILSQLALGVLPRPATQKTEQALVRFTLQRLAQIPLRDCSESEFYRFRCAGAWVSDAEWRVVEAPPLTLSGSVEATEAHSTLCERGAVLSLQEDLRAPIPAFAPLCLYQSESTLLDPSRFTAPCVQVIVSGDIERFANAARGAGLEVQLVGGPPLEASRPPGSEVGLLLAGPEVAMKVVDLALQGAVTLLQLREIGASAHH